MMIQLGMLLDALSLKSWSDTIFARYARGTDGDYPVHRAIWSMCARSSYEDARSLAADHWERHKSLRIGRDYIHVLLRLGDVATAIKVSEEMASFKDATTPWPRILHADMVWFFGKDEDKAMDLYLDIVPACEAMLPYHYAMAVIYKRITTIYRKRGDIPNLMASLDRFLSVSPSNFRDDEFIELAELKLAQGDREGAKQTLETSFDALRREPSVRQAYERLGFGEAPKIPPRKNPLPPISGVSRLAVQTGLITETQGPVDTVKRHVKDRIEPGDVVALSSCVGSILEGRMLMEGTVSISPVANFIARRIAGAHYTGAFKSSAPMANPLSAQTAIEEVGALRLLVAAVIGVIGKLFRIDGWFYIVAGSQVAQIDDILGSVPPYDYYVMMGPLDANKVSDEIAGALGHGVSAAVVDANDLGIAWAVGASKGLDVKWLELSMSDNPAGNQEQMTPIVIVRPDKQKEPEQSARGGDFGGTPANSEDEQNDTRSELQYDAENPQDSGDLGAVQSFDAGSRGAGAEFGHEDAHAVALISVGAERLGVVASTSPQRAGNVAHIGYLSKAMAVGKTLLRGPNAKVVGVVAGLLLVAALGAIWPSARDPADNPPGGVVNAGVPVVPVTTDQQIPVLLYHELTTEPVSTKGMVVTESEFRMQMSILSEHGYNSITTTELKDYIEGKITLPQNPVLITFDDGYNSVYSIAFPILQEYGLKATAFVVGVTLETPNHLTFDQLREMVTSGLFEIGSHTYNGHGGTSDSPVTASWTQEHAVNDLKALEAILKAEGVPMTHSFAYPFGFVNGSLEEAAKEIGYTIAFTTEPGMAGSERPLLCQRRVTVWPGGSEELFLKNIDPETQKNGL